MRNYWSTLGSTGTITYDEGTESFQVPEVQPVENGDTSAPKRMKIQQRYLEQAGFTSSCIKCRAIQRGDKTVTTGHSPECRVRVEAEMMKHEDLRDELEKANNRINEYIAKKIDENWTEKVRMANDGDNEQVPPMDMESNEIVHGKRS